MDPIELQKNIALYYSKLPSDAQVVFSSMAWLESLKQISQKYTLNEEQAKTLVTETTLALLSIISLEEYEQILTKELALPQESMDKMLGEINESILKTIRPALNKAYEQNTQPEVEEREKIEQALDERFQNLSDEIKDAITESDYYDKLYAIGKEHNLNVTEMGILEEVTTNTINGTIHPDKFEESLRNKLKLGDEETKNIVTAINEGILKQIRQKVMGLPKTAQSILVDSSPDEVQILKSDTEILGKAGIEILPTPPLPAPSPLLDTKELPAGTNVESPKPASVQSKEIIPARNAESMAFAGGEKEVKTPEKAPTLLEQKMFTSSFKIPPTKTEYSPNNLSKTNGGDPVIERHTLPTVDPYRELPQ